MRDKLARIAWRSNLTGATGHGDWGLLANVEPFFEEVKKKYPDIEHWIERKP